MKSILCPVDFSPSSTSASRYAAGLCVQTDAHLYLMHCYDVPTLYSDAPMTVIKDAVSQLHAQVDRKLAKLVSSLKKTYPALRVTAEAIQGPSARKIIDVASHKGMDMIVMGSTGTNRLTRLLIGSTVAAVLRESPCAVLTVPAKTVFKGVKKFAFATDLKEDNLKAAVALAPFAHKFDAEIAFVFVDDHHLLHSEESVEAFTRKVKSRVRYNKISGYISAHSDIIKGLQLFTRKNKCDMLVVYTHPRTFPETLFHESITRIAAHQADMPVLSIRTSDRPL